MNDFCLKCDELKEVIYRPDIMYMMRKHANQTRNDGSPYWLHPLKVASILASLDTDDSDSFATPTLIRGALFHDLLEDTDTTFEELKSLYGEQVADLVQELTNNCTGVEKHPNLLKHAKTYSPSAKMIKLCDRWCNVHDSVFRSNWDVQKTKKYAKEGLELIEAMSPIPIQVINLTASAIRFFSCIV